MKGLQLHHGDDIGGLDMVCRSELALVRAKRHVEARMTQVAQVGEEAGLPLSAVSDQASLEKVRTHLRPLRSSLGDR